MTTEWLAIDVPLHVSLQVAFLTKCSVAYLTRKGFVACVTAHVYLQVALLAEQPVAHTAPKWLLPGVGPAMAAKAGDLRK